MPSKKSKARDGPKFTLSEIGPRFVLVPVKIFEGSFGGATLYENKREYICHIFYGGCSVVPAEFVPPSSIAAQHREEKAVKYKNRQAATVERGLRQAARDNVGENELATRKVFA